MATFVISWWTTEASPDDDLLRRFKAELEEDILDAATTPQGRELYRSLMARFEFAEQYGSPRVERSGGSLFYTNREKTMGALIQTVGIMADFADDVAAVHYRLMFSDEPYEMSQDR